MIVMDDKYKSGLLAKRCKMKLFTFSLRNIQVKAHQRTKSIAKQNKLKINPMLQLSIMNISECPNCFLVDMIPMNMG